MSSVILVRSGLTGVQETCYFVFLKTLTLLASRFTLFCVCRICFVFVPGFSFLFVSVFSFWWGGLEMWAGVTKTASAVSSRV